MQARRVEIHRLQGMDAGMDPKHLSRKLHHLSRTACETYPNIAPWQTRLGISTAISAEVGG